MRSADTCAALTVLVIALTALSASLQRSREERIGDVQTCLLPNEIIGEDLGHFMYEDVNEPLGRPLDEAADRVAALEMAFVEMLAKCSWAKREQWCGALQWSGAFARPGQQFLHLSGGRYGDLLRRRRNVLPTRCSSKPRKQWRIR
jgi:hypothetical protein